ncbi:hypothetical protein HZ326_8615 [Fusarium oxysporum f. sp. albedinis]|jgi:hypothetical protein|nr:hypothetical protein HZ326_8615 [Fusarium oxysporum f. sp. albedinis]
MCSVTLSGVTRTPFLASYYGMYTTREQLEESTHRHKQDPRICSRYEVLLILFPHPPQVSLLFAFLRTLAMSYKGPASPIYIREQRKNYRTKKEVKKDQSEVYKMKHPIPSPILIRHLLVRPS